MDRAPEAEHISRSKAMSIGEGMRYKKRGKGGRVGKSKGESRAEANGDTETEGKQTLPIHHS